MTGQRAPLKPTNQVTLPNTPPLRIGRRAPFATAISRLCFRLQDGVYRA